MNGTFLIAILFSKIFPVNCVKYMEKLTDSVVNIQNVLKSKQVIRTVSNVL